MFCIIQIDPIFCSTIDSKALHINHKSGKISWQDKMNVSYIDNDTFSIYFSKYNKVMVDVCGSNKLCRLSPSLQKNVIKTDIPGFDLKLIKAFGALSDAYNKYNNGKKNSKSW
jgi:hypothetical protein